MAKQTPGRKQVLSIAIDPALVARVDELADAVNQSRSAFIERVVRQAVDEEGDAIRAFQHSVLGPVLVQAFSSREVLKSLAEVIDGDLDDEQLLLFRKGMVSIVGVEPPPRWFRAGHHAGSVGKRRSSSRNRSRKSGRA
jgi:hypothetical protein